jgi:peroxiredoxin
MTIAVGDRIPDVQVFTPSKDGPKPAPTCSDYHLPGFVLRADDLVAKGVTTIACISVNDAFVMGEWGAAREVGDKVVLIADGSASLTKALGLEVDLSGGGLGVRSKRFAAIFDDGVLTELAVEEGLGLDVSTADAVLAKL